MANDLIPFVNGEPDLQLATKFHSDAIVTRIPLFRAQDLVGGVKTPLWVDPCFDGLPKCDDESAYWKYFAPRDGSKYLRDSNFIQSPKRASIESLVLSVLDQCLVHRPAWISVPQLAQAPTTQHNRFNKLLAQITRHWRANRSYKGRMVLPLLFTHRSQLKNKTAWGARVTTAIGNIREASAEHVWIVDSSLHDSKCVRDFELERFPEIIRMHEHLADKTRGIATVIAGPYWAINLVLWARGLVTYPAIGLGGGYKYFPPGGHLAQSTPKLVLPALRKLVRADQGLRAWLRSPSKSGQTAGDISEFVEMDRRFEALLAKPRSQIAEFYRGWFDKLSVSPPAGRQLALYQDLSSAVVLGATLRDIKGEDGLARQPLLPARQYMVNCL